MTITVAAFYQFIQVPNPMALREALLPLASRLGLKGTLILAQEGLNGTLSGETDRVMAFLDALRAGSGAAPPMTDLTLKCAKAGAMPFRRLKIRVKPEIVTLAAQEADPSHRAGTYVAPEDWNALLADPDVLLVDTRNAFEVALGTFEGATDPGTIQFTAFPAFVSHALNPMQHRKIAMFCTGGIRCEKASSLLLARGFPEVYHLKGGILAYLDKIPAAQSRWQGECFVFDERVSVGYAAG